MGTSGRRRTGDQGSSDAEPSARAADTAADAEEASEGQGQGEGQSQGEDEGVRLRPERRWAQLTAAGMPTPPESANTASSGVDGEEPQQRGEFVVDSLAASGPALQVVLGAVAGAIVVVLILAMNGQVPRAADLPAGDASSVPTAFAATSPAPTAAVGGVTSLFEAFDDLPMYSKLPPPWRVTGEGSAEIVALPTSVDRSVRLASSELGASTALCRPTGVGAATGLRVAFDYLLGRSPAGEVELLTLQAAGAGSINVLIGPNGAAVGVSGPDGRASGSSPPPAPPGPSAGSTRMEWQRLVVNVDPRARTVSWVGHNISGATTGSGTASVGIARRVIEHLCVRSPAGTAGWIAVDDLIVEG